LIHQNLLADKSGNILLIIQETNYKKKNHRKQGNDTKREKNGSLDLRQVTPAMKFPILDLTKLLLSYQHDESPFEANNIMISTSTFFVKICHLSVL